MRPVINTKKHLVQFSVFAVASGAITNLLLSRGVAVVGAGNPDVLEGSKISAIYVEMWLTSDDTAQGSVICTLEKVPGANSVLMTAAESAALNDYDNKKNIFHTQMGLLGPNASTIPIPVIKGWFKIPKSKQRQGLNDRLILNIHGQSNGVSGCGIVIYKEQY